MSKKPYNGPWGKAARIRPLPQVQPGYSGRNENGGRKCAFSQSSDYRPWPTYPNWMPCSYGGSNASLLDSGIKSVATRWGT